MKIKLIFVVLVCAIFAGEALSQSAAREGGVPGVTAPFIPFPEKDKIKYEDAVERAKKDDPEAYYWLSYYFVVGEGVTQDSKAASEFLQKAADLGSAKADYLIALHHEWFSLKDENGKSLGGIGNRNVCPELAGVSWVALGGFFSKFDEKIFRKPEVPKSATYSQWFCCTNDVVVQFVIDLYSTAVNGGLPYATNNIDRLRLRATQCRERIAVANAAQTNSKAALNLLGNVDSKNSEEKERERQEEERKQQQEYWSTWPKSLGEGHKKLVYDAEKKFNCVIDNSGGFTNVWTHGGGKSLIVGITGNWRRDRYCKIDSDGKIVAWTSRDEDLEELKWFNEERERRLDELRAKWAEERGMSLEEAKSKYDEWMKSLSPRSLFASRLNRRGGAALKGQGK